MFYNLTMMVLLVFFCWLWGNAFVKMFYLRKDLYFFEVSIGYLLMVIVLHLLYFRLDLNIRLMKIVVILISVSALAYVGKGFEKKSLHSFAYVFLFFLLSAGVAWLSWHRGFGESFYVFRGNVDDHFNYISVGYAITKHPFSYYLNTASDLLFSEDDLLICGARLLIDDRAAVTLPFALLLEEGKGSIYWSAYLYMSFLYAMLAPVLYGFYRKLIKNGSFALKNLFLAGYLAGFWGQIHFDLNAWSQLGGIPIVFTIIKMILLQLEKDRAKICVGGGKIGLVLSIAAAFLIYPEAAMVYAAGMGIYLMLYYIRERKQFQIKKIFSWFFLLIAAALVIVAIHSNYKGLFNFMQGQLIGGITMKTDAYRMFDSYWVGRNASDHPIIDVCNHMLSAIGFYFLIPSDQKIDTGLLAFLEITVLLIILAGIGLKFWKYLKRGKTEETEFLWDYFFGYTVILIAYLYRNQNYWVLGKVMIWMSPFIYYILLFLIDTKWNYVKRFYMAAGGFVATVNVFFFLARIELAGQGTCSWYQNYPLQEGLRASAEWDLNMERLETAKIIRIEDNYEGHYFHYLKQTIAFAGKEYYTDRHIVLPYGAGEDYGTMDMKPYDAFAYLKADEHGKRKLQYVLHLNGKLPADVIYQKHSFSPFDVLIRENSGFLEGDPTGVWTTEPVAKVKLLEPFEYHKLRCVIDISGFAKAASEEDGKTFHIKIGEENKTLVLVENGAYTVWFDNVKGLDEITFVTDKLLTPFDMGLSEDTDTGFGVRLKSMQLYPGS